MARIPSALLELALAKQEARNAAALAAIRARASDINEAQRLVEALAARGCKIRGIVDTTPIGALAICNIALWISTTRPQLAEAMQWFAGADIAIARDALFDRGDLQVYQVTLRGQKLRLNVAIHPTEKRRFSFIPSHTPEAA